MAGLLGLTISGAPLARRATEVDSTLREAGWTTDVVVSDAARQWTDVERRATGARRPGRVVACPLTFTTANKVAAGIMDNSVTGMWCDALGVGTPILAVPFVNERLWGHPAWADTLRTLALAGVVFLDAHTGRTGPPVPVRSGTGADVVDAFDPTWLLAALDP